MKRIVLAHSGAAGTRVAIPRLAAQYRAEVVTMTLDLGQDGQLDDVRDRALGAGAARAHVIDAREEFARDFILPALRASALADDRFPLIPALARSAIARRLHEVANIEGASAVAHGATDGPAFTTLLGSLGSTIDVIVSAERVSGPDNGRQFRTAVVSAGRRSSVPDDDRQDPPAYVEIAFDRGVAVAINGVEMSLVDLIQSLETIAGAHGVGGAGASLRLLCEAPAAIVLQTAHAALGRIALPADVERRLDDVAVKYADLALAGLWFTPARVAMDEALAPAQPCVSGAVRLELHKGECRVVGADAATGCPGPKGPGLHQSDGAPRLQARGGRP